MPEQNNEGVSILCVILDVNWYWWAKVLEKDYAPPADPQADTPGPPALGPMVVDGVIAFCGAYLMQHSGHQLLLMTAGSGGSSVVYPATAGEDTATGIDPSSSTSVPPGPVSKAGISQLINAPFEPAKVRRRIQQIILDESSTPLTASAGVVETKMAGCLAKALCFMNRLTKSPDGQGQARTLGDARILVVKVSDDATTQYMNLMNTFFTAQKSHVTIDACLLHQPSTIFQQACDITGGICLQLPAVRPLLQYLMTVFAIPPSARNLTALPRNGNVDYRPACFCHQRLTDLAFVCSVCLSVFCDWRPICSTCDTHFPLPKNIRSLSGGRKRKLQKQAAGASGGSNVSTPNGTPYNTPPLTPVQP